MSKAGVRPRLSREHRAKLAAAKRKDWRPFAQARTYAHSLGLPSARAYERWARTTARPADIPTNPSVVYACSGWVDWGDWLGTGTVWARRRAYRPFSAARAYARSLGLGTHKEWNAWSRSGKRPLDIPSNPEAVYGAEWAGWPDFLGARPCWTRTALVGFIRSLIPVLPDLEAGELYTILSAQGLRLSGAKTQARRDLLRAVRSLVGLADAALDGVIPEGVLESEQTMLQRSLDALHTWIARLEATHEADEIRKTGAR